MPGQLTNDPVLARFRAELDKMYGDRIERVILFGSRARGDARHDSDYDVAIFLKDLKDRWSEFDRLAGLETRITIDSGAVIHALPFPSDAYRERTALMGEIREEGVDM
jgi:predicted nucleotidyltransferase